MRSFIHSLPFQTNLQFDDNHHFLAIFTKAVARQSSSLTKILRIEIVGKIYVRVTQPIIR